jgi:hypothetical protein
MARGSKVFRPADVSESNTQCVPPTSALHRLASYDPLGFEILMPKILVLHLLGRGLSCPLFAA